MPDVGQEFVLDCCPTGIQKEHQPVDILLTGGTGPLRMYPLFWAKASEISSAVFMTAQLTDFFVCFFNGKKKHVLISTPS